MRYWISNTWRSLLGTLSRPQPGRPPDGCRARPSLEGLETRLAPAIVAGSNLGAQPRVYVSDNSGTPVTNFLAYDAVFRGGVRVAQGDINNDGTPDIITAAGLGGGPHIRVFDGKTFQQISGPLGSFFAFHPAYLGGIYVAAGDVTGDGHDDIVVGAGFFSSHVRVFDGANGQEARNFYAFSPILPSGVRIAAGNFDGDAADEIVAVPGLGSGPHVKVFDDSGTTVLQSFFAFDPTYLGGLNVAAGDVDHDGTADVIVGAGLNSSHVRVLSGKTNGELLSQYAYGQTDLPGGVRVAAVNVDGDAAAELVTGPGFGGGPHVRTFDVTGGAGVPVASFFAFDARLPIGIFVG